jgi:translation initiation factor 1
MSDKIVFSTDASFRQPDPLRLSFQRGAKGSGVTRVERLILHPTLKEQLLSQLKKRLGCGGAVKDGNLEFQGDHRDVVEAELVKQGYKVKRVGG